MQHAVKSHFALVPHARIPQTIVIGMEVRNDSPHKYGPKCQKSLPLEGTICVTVPRVVSQTLERMHATFLLINARSLTSAPSLLLCARALSLALPALLTCFCSPLLTSPCSLTNSSTNRRPERMGGAQGKV